MTVTMVTECVSALQLVHPVQAYSIVSVTPLTCNMTILLDSLKPFFNLST